MMIHRKELTSFTKNYDSQNYLQQELYELVQQDERIFNFLQEAVLDGVWFWDLDHPENEWMSPRFWTTLGYNPNDMPHKASAWQDIIFEEDLNELYANFTKHSHNSEYPFNQVVRYYHKLGHTVWILCRGLILRDEQGTPRRMLGAHVDISKEKKSEFDLRKQIQNFKHIINGTDLGTWQWNAQTGETIFDERWAEIIGYSLDELGSTTFDTWAKYVHPEDVKKSNLRLQEHFEGLTPIYECEVRMKHKNGEYVWVLTKGKVVSWHEEGNPEWVLGSHQEITQKKKDFERNRLFIEQTPSAIAMLDKKMNYLAASKKWFEVYDIENKDIIGRSQQEILPEMSKIWQPNYQRCLEGNVIKRDEECVEKTDGTIQWLSWELCPWYTDENKVGGLVIHTSDITKIRREKELSSLLKVAEDQNKRLKNFAHIVSHNLKSHSSNFEMLLDLFVQEDPTVLNNEIVGLLKSASINLSETISHLNEVVLLSTLTNENLIPVDLKETIDNAARSVQVIADESNVQINNIVEKGLKVLAIPAYLDSILLNLFTNAIKYSDQKKKSYVSVSAKKENKFVIINVKDNGIGIDLKKHRSRIFGMYKTFHNHDDARGIGLFITKNQVEAIGGAIEVESEVNQGSTFILKLKYEKS